MTNTADSGTTFDLVILGGGSGGYAAAFRAAELGLSVGLVEKDKVGGTCLHRGCIPTKALLHAAEVADSAREGEQFGVRTTFEGVDMGGVHKYKDGVVDRLFKGLQGQVKARGITVIEGEGRLDLARPPWGRRHDLHRQTTSSSPPARTPVAARSRAGRPPGDRQRTRADPGSRPGVGGRPRWRRDRRRVRLRLDLVRHEVTIVEALPRLVPAEDADCGKALERAFRKRKIAFKTGTAFESVALTESGVQVTVAGGEVIEAELLLVAVGRGPNTSGLGYEEVGVALDRGFVTVDATLQTSVPGVYAIGDIVPGLQLAHRGFQQGIFVAEHIAGLNPTPIDEAGIPRVTYSEPEVASVGLTEEQAREKYGEVEILNYNLGGNGKSQILKTSGFVKLVRAKDGAVVGLHMVGSRVGELIGEAQLIYNWEAYPADVAPLVHAHPTQNEALGEAHLALAGKPLHFHD